MILRRLLTGLGVTLASVAAAQGQTDLPGLYDREIDNRELRIVDAASLRGPGEAYARHFARDVLDLAALDDDALAAAFDAAFQLAFYAEYYDPASRPVYLDDAWQRFQALQARRVAITAKRQQRMYHLLMSARRFDDAATLRRDWPEVEGPPIPVVHQAPAFDPARPAVYELEDDRDTFTLRNVDLASEAQIIVVVGARCHFARQAALTLQADPTLREAFVKGRAIWLAPASDLDADAIRAWRDAVPGVPMRVAYRNAAWTPVDFSSTPYFHFFSGGVLQHRQDGWNEGFERSLEQPLRDLGVLTP